MLQDLFYVLYAFNVQSKGGVATTFDHLLILTIYPALICARIERFKVPENKTKQIWGSVNTTSLR